MNNKNNRWTTICVFLITLTLVSSNITFAQKNNDQKRKQSVVKRDSTGMIVKTFDGFVYRIFDKQGRLIESYGNRKTIDMDDNFKTIIEITDSIVIAKEYFFEPKNTECKIVDPLDYYISKGYYKDGRLFKIEYWNPVKDKKNRVIEHKLTETNDNPAKDNFISFLPAYLK